MRLVVLGATGGTGGMVVQRALDGGHDVTAAARHPERIALEHPRLQKATADVMEPDSLDPVFRGADAVVNCVGVSSPGQARKGTKVYSIGTENVLGAMERTGRTRIIAVSSAGVGPRKGAPVLYKAVVRPLFLEPAYEDMRVMERLLEESGLDWTVVRPPQLTEDRFTPDYRLQADMNFDDDHPLPRASLAQFLVDEAVEARFVWHVVAISG